MNGPCPHCGEFFEPGRNKSQRFCSNHCLCLWNNANSANRPKIQPNFTDFREEDRGHDTPCWIPNRVPCTTGYILIPDGKGGRQLAHRAYHEHYIGPIPEGHEVDHLCEQRACSNPAHLEAVPPSVNRLRSMTPPSLHALKTHCIYGHPFDEENTYTTPAGHRQCRTCNRRRAREGRRKAAA